MQLVMPLSKPRGPQTPGPNLALLWSGSGPLGFHRWWSLPGFIAFPPFPKVETLHLSLHCGQLELSFKTCWVLGPDPLASCAICHWNAPSRMSLLKDMFCPWHTFLPSVKNAGSYHLFSSGHNSHWSQEAAEEEEEHTAKYNGGHSPRQQNKSPPVAK